MKQYTTPKQTAKLIELGFEKPKSEVRSERGPFSSDARKAYSIGELLLFLPRVISSEKFDYATINIYHDTINWVVGYDDVDGVKRFLTSDIELIDALCVLCRKLKAEGVI